MQRRFVYMALILMLFLSCEEYYRPAIDQVSGMLVIESLVTNDPKQNFVKLSVTDNFFDTNTKDTLINANVELLEIGHEIIPAIEESHGYFRFTKMPVPGLSYKLRISCQNDIYESDTVVMPPLPMIDTLYTEFKMEKTFRNDTYGPVTQIDIPVRQIYIDAPITSSLEYYRFNWRAILQWNYSPASAGGIPPPAIYGWLSVLNDGLFNLAGPKQHSVSGKVEKHPITYLAYDSKRYLWSSEQSGSGWILILEQYGISKASNDFHERLNNQLSAEGSLFEPMLNQVYGNIHCVSDNSKIALGYFAVNSYRQYRYFLNLGYDEKSEMIQRQIFRYPDIPQYGEQAGVIPYFWEN